MAEPVVDSKIVIPFVPTFYHLALVKVAVPMFYKYGKYNLKMALTDIQLQNSPSFDEDVRRAHEALLFIPAHLRQSVLEAVNGIWLEVFEWRWKHYFLTYEKTECWDFMKAILYDNFLFWRSDGTIDRIKTAQELVLNKKFSIEMRFKIACKYCLTERIKTLWAEMAASGKTKNYVTTDHSIEKGWIEWINGGTPADWTRAVLRQRRLTPLPRYSSFLFSLESQERKQALTFIDWHDVDFDDLRFCLYAMTGEEKEIVFKMDVGNFLYLFTLWPLQIYFLEMAEKVKNYIDFNSFRSTLRLIMLRRVGADFDYNKLIVGFLTINPDHHKELLQEIPHFNNGLHKFLRENGLPKKEHGLMDLFRLD